MSLQDEQFNMILLFVFLLLFRYMLGAHHLLRVPILLGRLPLLVLLLPLLLLPMELLLAIPPLVLPLLYKRLLSLDSLLQYRQTNLLDFLLAFPKQCLDQLLLRLEHQLLP